MDGVEATDAQLKDYRTDNPNPIPLFYQSGYLTITGYDRRFRLYSLAFPNEEVRYGFLNALVPCTLGEADAESPWSARRMTLALERGDADALRDQLSSLFASVPYVEGNAPEYEGVWRNQVYLVFALLGQFVECEVHTAKGRCDVVVQTAGYLWVIELKVDGSATEALAQIGERGYAERFAADPRQVIRVGCAFSSEERNISEWACVPEKQMAGN